MKTSPKTQYVRIKPELPFKPWLLILPTLLVATVNDANALQVNIQNHWMRDYLDMAQNKGMFERGATGLEIKRKDGTVLKLPNVPYPDMGVVSNQGSVTSIGGAYMVTATHNKKFGPWHHSVLNPSWGNTTYTAQAGEVSVDYGIKSADFSAVRLDKFVVETRGVGGIDTSLSYEDFVDRYGVMIDGKKQVIAYRAGAGMLSIQDNNGRVDYKDISYRPELLGASFYTLSDLRKGTEWINFKNMSSLSNITTTGDSGSGIMIWDNLNQQWVSAGALHGIASSSKLTWFMYAKWNQEAVDKLKKQHTHEVALNKGELTFDSNDIHKYTIGGIAGQFEDRKDLSFTGGGTINLTKDLHLGIGGLIFDKDNNYVVKGESFSYKGAGIDIGKGSTLEWNVKGVEGDNLHKIGQGTMNVNVTQGNNLKVGDGTVVLKAEKSFNNIHMTNGYATVKLDHDKALNTDNGRNGIYFARHGGTLDVNGHSLTFEQIAAADDGATITNTNESTRADINFNLKAPYAYHGNFNGNLNVKHEFNDKVDDETLHNKRNLILDGDVMIKGDISVKNAKLTMQGLPVTHATFGEAKCNLGQFQIPCAKDYVSDIKNKENEANNKHNSHYMSNNQRNDFSQPDWKQRTFMFDNLKLDGAALAVGRNTNLFTNIDAKDSKIQFGGNIKTFRDNYAGDNVTGFDFRQDLKEGESILDESIYFEGDIKADNSTITSHMKMMSASFDLSHGSKFTAVDKNSLTRILDKGIHVKDTSSLELGNVFISQAQKEVVIEKDEQATLTMQNVDVTNATVRLPGLSVQGTLAANRNANVFVDQWNLHDGNLESSDNGMINIDTLNVAGMQKAESANITVNKLLHMSDVNPNKPLPGAHEWVGLSVNNLTLKQNSKVTAEFSNDFLSIANLSLNKQHTLIQANELKDERSSHDIAFTLKGEAVGANSKIEGNKVVFTLTDNRYVKKSNAGFRSMGYGFAAMQDDRLLDDDTFYSPVGYQYMQEAKSDTQKAIISAIVQNNDKSEDKFQEAAVIDALSMADVDAGVEALNKIADRTEKIFDQTAKTINPDSYVKPIRNVVDSRLASLRRAAYKSVAQYAPVAGVGDFMEMSKISDAQMANQSIYVDFSGGLEKNGTFKENVLSSNLGYDHLFSFDKQRLVLGIAGSVTSLNKEDVGSKDEGLMYSATGYLSFEQKEGFEFQSYLTAGYLKNDRTFTPDIFIGEQKFDEDSWILMSSNYFKYHFRTGNLSIKPMLLADFGWSHTSDSESQYFKRDSLNDTTVDFGAGLEIEGFNEDMGYLLQFTAKKNIYSSADSIGINLKNSDGYITYGINEKDDVRFAANAMITKRVSEDILLDLGLGATANTNGSKGINASTRVRWIF